MKALLLCILALTFASCEFEKADYYEYRYGSNIDFGQDTGNKSGSSFDFGSSNTYKSNYSGNKRLYWGDAGNSSKDTKKDYFRHYRGTTTDED